jgi:F-type H+-transporting ATPase subunit delta
MISVGLSRRYARALLNLSRRQGNLETTDADLQGVSRVFEADPRVRRFFETPNIARAEKESFLDQHWKPRVQRTVFGLLALLLRRRRLDHLVSIADEFHKVAEEAQGIVRTTVRSAAPITERQADTLSRALERRTGKKIILAREVDPTVVGGAVVSLDHQVIDGTLATALWRIRRQLLQTRVHGRG